MELIDPNHLISTFGLLGLTIIVFSESCFAFFLPGDSLLFTAGLLAGEGKYGLNLWTIAICVTIAAILGNQVGYLMGRRFGSALFSREQSRFFKPKHYDKTHAYFEHHGPKTIVLARFIPIIRTFACVVAGAARMNYRTFVIFNVVGGVLWGTGLTLLGWVVARTLGEAIDIDRYLLPIILLIIAVSFIPVVREYFKARRQIAAATLRDSQPEAEPGPERPDGGEQNHRWP